MGSSSSFLRNLHHRLNTTKEWSANRDWLTSLQNNFSQGKSEIEHRIISPATENNKPPSCKSAVVKYAIASGKGLAKAD